MVKSYNVDIDFVLLWNNDQDPAWQTSFSSYAPAGVDCSSARFRDWGLLRFWLRSVEVYAPWVHRIFIVSSCQMPLWLDYTHPKVKWVYHKDYIPEKYLPTFNSHTIELNLHRIPQLSEHFVYFNDDMFINAPVLPEYYFLNGLPCDITAECLFHVPVRKCNDWGTALIELCNVGVINSHFSRKAVVKNHFSRWYGRYLPLPMRVKALFLSRSTTFFGFFTPHFERPLLKSVFSEVWQAEPDYLDNSCSRFRTNDSVNIYLIRLWQLVTNRFYPDNCRLLGHYYDVKKDNINDICQDILESSSQSLCINDVPDCSIELFYTVRNQVQSAFEKKFPNKSKYEIL